MKIAIQIAGRRVAYRLQYLTGGSYKPLKWVREGSTKSKVLSNWKSYQTYVVTTTSCLKAMAKW